MSAHDAIRKAAHDALCGLRIPHADHVWMSPIPFFDEVAGAVETALSAAGYTITLIDDGATDTPPPVAAGAESATSTVAPSSPHRYRLAWLSARRRASYASKAFFAEARAARELEGATPAIDREVLARAAHEHFCVMPGELTHEPDEIDYDKADEILEILARIDVKATDFRGIYEAAASLQTAEDIATIAEEYADDLEPPTTVEWLELRDWFKDLLHKLAARAREAGGSQ